MRIVTLVLSFLVILLLTGMALTYVPSYIGQQRIYVQADSTSEVRPYYSYGQASPEVGAGAADPYHQRYYSESEGWTYYTLPANGADQ
jgi:hypothetical protein